MPPKWKGEPGRDWSTCECRNCRWLRLDAVPCDVDQQRWLDAALLTVRAPCSATARCVTMNSAIFSEAQPSSETAGENMCWAELADDLYCSSSSVSDYGEDSDSASLPRLKATSEFFSIPEHSELHSTLNFSNVRMKSPCVWRRVASIWPAFQQWSNSEYLASLSNIETLVLHSSDGCRFLKRRCQVSHQPFSAVVEALFSPKAHVLSSLSANCEPFYARAEMSPLLLGHCNFACLEKMMGSSVNVSNCGVWMGSAGNVTPFHYDLCHGFLIQIIGEKTFTLASPDDFRSMYQSNENPEISQVDYEAWCTPCDKGSAERALHPRFAGVQLFRVTLAPGDVMYTPPFWWHHVETGSANAVSVLVPFDQAENERQAPHICHGRSL